MCVALSVFVYCVQSTRGSRPCPETFSTSRTSSTGAPSKGESFGGSIGLTKRSIDRPDETVDRTPVGQTTPPPPQIMHIPRLRSTDVGANPRTNTPPTHRGCSAYYVILPRRNNHCPPGSQCLPVTVIPQGHPAYVALRR